MTTSRAAAFAALYAASRVSADVADHWVQTDHQAVTKSKTDHDGRIACLAHVASYVATQAATVAALAPVLGIRITPGKAMAAALISGATHYIADRRTPVRRLAESTGKGRFYALGGPLGGAYLLDQAAHHAAELVAVAVLSTSTPK
jgi:N-acetylglucosamine kinase-like BadF-type ATPase